jgi:hypothetical protein
VVVVSKGDRALQVTARRVANLETLRATGSLARRSSCGAEVYIRLKVRLGREEQWRSRWCSGGGERLDDFLEDFPTVTREQAVAFLEQAASAYLDHVA